MWWNKIRAFVNDLSFDRSLSPYDEGGFEEIRDRYELFCLGYGEFPLTDEVLKEAREIEERIEDPLLARYFAPLDDLSLYDEEVHKRIRKIISAHRLFEVALILWDYALENYAVPLNITDWKYDRDKPKTIRYDANNMKELARLVGVDSLLKAYRSGVPLSDLLS